ncbi:hypothetical protein F5876DRAFT_68565 [Lentinula aff. lateritia]|uniref:Uncharacterized protein n=1 Tax=Lentinula aff. lateritia TaxID=2804960 RepID=A0ACC1TQB0_9AGAR|nr:hypothetical protein F5876DRAFT_68565 [Lentinula aff. lateritia]
MLVVLNFPPRAFLTLLLLFFSTILGVVTAVPLTSYDFSKGQLEQRAPTVHNVYLYRSNKGLKVREKTNKEFVLSQAQDWEITFGSAVGFRSQEVAHGMWAIEVIKDKKYRLGDSLGFISIENREEEKMFEDIKKLRGSTKFDVQKTLMDFFKASNNGVKFTGAINRMGDPWDNAYMAMTDPAEYKKKFAEGGAQWNVELRLKEQEEATRLSAKPGYSAKG